MVHWEVSVPWTHHAPSSIEESLRTLANDSMELIHWELVLNKNRFSIPIDKAEYKAKSCSKPPVSRVVEETMLGLVIWSF